MKHWISRFYNFYHKQDPLIFWPTAISLILAFFTLIFFILIYQNLPVQIPLFYSLPWGESQLAALPQFTILPALLTIITLTNLIILSQLHPSQIIPKRILALSSLLSAILLTITALKIMSIFI